jgi:aminotransferase
MFLLKHTGVACVPGEAFYHDDGGENLLRFCFAKDPVMKSCHRIEKLNSVNEIG